MRVQDVSGADAHVADLLALYHLDALDRRSREQVGRHLQSCPPCRAAATEVCETLAALALLSDDRDHLLNVYGALGTAAPPAFPARFAPQEPPREQAGPQRRDAQETDRRRLRLRRGGTEAETATRPAPPAAVPDLGRREPPQQRVEPPPVAPVQKLPPIQEQAALPVVPSPKPAAPRPVAHPSRPGFDRPSDIQHPGNGQRAKSPRRRFFSWRAATFAALSALLLLTLTVAGLSARALLDPPAPGVQTDTVRTAVASATDRDSGANLSVILTEDGDRVAVRATLSGLTEGVGYRLFGYTFDGRQRPLVNWTGHDGLQELDGELPVGIADLSHFAVTRGNRVVVTAYLRRDADTAATPGR
ncbi:zf-HC2 domain-containing protein [Micromonospora zamorensis]|uniref:zf-HC2 domain-containing protein n=1 Tax=Micromonospora zamorensis TaxID=709883 RepID=UPI0033ED744D